MKKRGHQHERHGPGPDPERTPPALVSEKAESRQHESNGHRQTDGGMAVEDRVDRRPQLLFVQAELSAITGVVLNGTGPSFSHDLRFFACRHHADPLALPDDPTAPRLGGPLHTLIEGRPVQSRRAFARRDVLVERIADSSRWKPRVDARVLTPDDLSRAVGEARSRTPYRPGSWRSRDHMPRANRDVPVSRRTPRGCPAAGGSDAPSGFMPVDEDENVLNRVGDFVP